MSRSLRYTPLTMTSMRTMKGETRHFSDSLVCKDCQPFFRSYPPGAGRGKSNGPPTPHNGKKTKGRVRKNPFFPIPPKCVLSSNNPLFHKVKIKMEFIDNKLRRYTTFSKRKTGIMKKVSENFLNHGCCGPPQDKDI